MNRYFSLAACGLSLLGAALAQDESGQNIAPQVDSAAAAPKQKASDENNDTVQRGKYLVHHVAMCIYCHSPRNEDGTIDRRRLLTGAPMPVKSPFRGQQWAFRAPSLAGLPGGWSEEQLTHFLQTGEPPTGYEVRLPMPPFRLTEQDAAAVVAYLKSLQ